MKGIFDSKYTVNVTKAASDGDQLSLSLSFSGRQYPDFMAYMDGKFFNKEPVYYKDDNIKGRFIMVRSSFSGEPIDDDVRDMLNLESQRNGRIHFHERRDFWNYIFSGSMTLKLAENKTIWKCDDGTYSITD